MAGFLDSKDRVIDMVLTEVGKSLLMRGELNFRYWVPFDDEVDYWPQTSSTSSGQSLSDRARELTESPLIREAASGYRGGNLVAQDTTNLQRPMYTAPPGAGQLAPLPQMLLSTSSLVITMMQKNASTLVGKSNVFGQESNSRELSLPEQVQRFGATEAILTAGYSTGSYPQGHKLDGFLVTVYLSTSVGSDLSGNVTGGYERVHHNRDSSGSIAYRNDLKLSVYTP